MILSMFRKIKNLFGSKSGSHVTLETDLHSHLIPGIDDGAKTMEESLALVRALYALGYRKLITTPHTMPHRFPNTSERILEGLEKLKTAVAQAGIDVTIEAASEYYLDEHFLKQIQEKSLLTFGQNEVLFEMSYVIAPPELDRIIFELQSSGYIPVLAHPERYLYFHDDFEKYEALKQRGVRFQVNINSLGGYYSWPMQAAAKKLASQGWIDYLGSDTHHQRHIDALKRTLEKGVLSDMRKNNTILNGTL
jgi:protein-tyrosine phosphatase